MQVIIDNYDEGVIVMNLPSSVRFNIPPERLSYYGGYIIYYFLGLITIVVGYDDETVTGSDASPCIHIPIGMGKLATGPIMEQNFVLMVGKDFYAAMREAFETGRNSFEVSQATMDAFVLRVDNIASLG